MTGLAAHICATVRLHRDPFFEQLLHSDAVQSRVGGPVPRFGKNVLSKSLKLFDLKNGRPDFKVTQRVKLYWGENHHEFQN